MLHPLQVLGWPLLAPNKPLAKSTERRLRKMSHEYRPSSFNLSFRAQVLCVGAAVVYRAEISVTMRSSYLLVPSWRNRQVHSWVIALSQSKFLSFCSQASAILQHPAVAQFFIQPEGAWNPVVQFFRCLARILHRSQLLRATFDSQAAGVRMSDSKHAVEVFLNDCWSALEIIIPVLAARPHLPASLSRETLSLYVLLRDLLSFPESLLEADQIYAKAILNLRDVEDAPHARCTTTCCICLEALVSTRPQTNEAMDAHDWTPQVPLHDPVPVRERKFSVELPCSHVFHENCIMAWLRQNPTCPECRARADLVRPSPPVALPMAVAAPVPPQPQQQQLPHLAPRAPTRSYNNNTHRRRQHRALG